MRHPERVLNNLSKHSNHSDYKFERLYRILFNEEMYYRAYQKLSKKQGNTTKGSDGKSIDGTSLKKIKQLIEELKRKPISLCLQEERIFPKRMGRCVRSAYLLSGINWCRKS